MRRTEVVDRPQQIQAPLHRGRAAGGGARATPEDRQARAERPVQAFDERGVQDLAAGRAPQQGQEPADAPLGQAVDGAGHRPSGVLLDDLGDHQVRPADQPRAPTRPRLPRPKGAPHDVAIGRQAIGHEEPRPPGRAGRNQRHHAPVQRAVTRGTYGAAQPEAGADHHGQRDPQHPRLCRDADLVGLHLLQVAGLDDRRVMHRCGMLPCRFQPVPDGMSLQAVGVFNATIGQPQLTRVMTWVMVASSVRRRWKMVPVRAPKVFPQTRQR